MYTPTIVQESRGPQYEAMSVVEWLHKIFLETKPRQKAAMFMQGQCADQIRTMDS
jgi:hypothetical protein